MPRPETTLPLETINAPFFAPLTRDLAYSGVFAIAPIPPNIPATAWSVHCLAGRPSLTSRME